MGLTKICTRTPAPSPLVVSADHPANRVTSDRDECLPRFKRNVRDALRTCVDLIERIGVVQQIWFALMKFERVGSILAAAFADSTRLVGSAGSIGSKVMSGNRFSCPGKGSSCGISTSCTGLRPARSESRAAACADVDGGARCVRTACDDGSGSVKCW